MNGDVTNSGHDTAEGAHRRKNPADPDGPKEGQYQIDRSTARQTQESRRSLLVDIPKTEALGSGLNRFFQTVGPDRPAKEDDATNYGREENE